MSTMRRTSGKIDIAIAGGGVSGLYSAYRLKQAHPNKEVVVFEALPILGGRIQQASFLGGLFSTSYGAHIIEPDYQTHMTQFIQELGLPVQKLEVKASPSSGKPQLDRLTHEERQYLSNHPELSADAALLDLGLRKILGIQWDLDNDNSANPDRDKQLKKLKLEATFDGRPLYEQGAWNVFAKVLSHEAIEFCREKGDYNNMKNNNQNAADWIALLLNHRIVRQAPYIPQGGMIGLINALADKCSEVGVRFEFNHRLTSLQPEDKESVHLKFELNPDDPNRGASPTDWVADHVILAMPQAPLKKLAANFPKRVNALLESVVPINLLWVHAALQNPPWDDSVSSMNAENAPVRSARFTHKMHEGNSYGTVKFLCDDPWYHYWSAYVENEPGDYEGYHASPQVNQNPRLKEEIEKNLQRLFGTTVPPIVAEWGIRAWGRQPFGAGVHFWKLGAQSYVVIQQLKAFSLNESSSVNNVHICGEAYSERQGYCEGALRTAERVVKAIQRTYQAQASVYQSAPPAVQTSTPRTTDKAASQYSVSALRTMGFTSNLQKENELAKRAAETTWDQMRWNDPKTQHEHDKRFGLIVHRGSTR